MPLSLSPLWPQFEPIWGLIPPITIEEDYRVPRFERVTVLGIDFDKVEIMMGYVPSRVLREALYYIQGRIEEGSITQTLTMPDSGHKALPLDGTLDVGCGVLYGPFYQHSSEWPPALDRIRFHANEWPGQNSIFQMMMPQYSEDGEIRRMEILIQGEGASIDRQELIPSNDARKILNFLRQRVMPVSQSQSHFFRPGLNRPARRRRPSVFRQETTGSWVDGSGRPRQVPENTTENDPGESTTYPQERLTSTTPSPISSVVTEQPNEVPVLVSNRTFGVELEVNRPSHGPHAGMEAGELAIILSGRGLPTAYMQYTHINTPNWKIVTDASVPNGYELVSPVLKGEAGLEELRKVSAVLVEYGFKISRNCGFHVHVGHAGMTGQEIINVMLRYAKFDQEHFDWMMPPSRRGSPSLLASQRGLVNNQTLNNIGHQEWRDVVGRHARQRHVKVNLATFLYGRNHPTIEFRHHSGTIEAEKIVNWVKFAVAFVEATIKRARWSGEVAMPVAGQNERVDVLSKVKKKYRGQTTKAWLAAEFLLGWEAAGRTNGYSRAEIGARIGQEETQVSVILQAFKERGYGLVITKMRAEQADGAHTLYKLVPPLVNPEVTAREMVPAELPADSWDFAIPSELVTFYNARKRLFGAPSLEVVPNEVGS